MLIPAVFLSAAGFFFVPSTASAARAAVLERFALKRSIFNRTRFCLCGRGLWPVRKARAVSPRFSVPTLWRRHKQLAIYGDGGIIHKKLIVIRRKLFLFQA